MKTLRKKKKFVDLLLPRHTSLSQSPPPLAPDPSCPRRAVPHRQRRCRRSRSRGPRPPPTRGICMMSTSWRDKQTTTLSTSMTSSSTMGAIIAFIFETNRLREWSCCCFSKVRHSSLPCLTKTSLLWCLVNALKRQYKNLYVFVAVPTVEQIKSFNQFYFKYGMELGCPTFVPVNDSEMGFEMILKIAHARGVCKQQDISSTMRNEREQAVQSMDAYIRVLTSIPGIDDHDANMVEKMADIRVREAIQKAKETEHRRSPNITGLHGVHFTLALTYCILIQNYTEYFHLSTMHRTHRKQNKC
ncbi:hypothetical protein ZWY2020_004691 [Hordeum vulgare]|nr:hypothetical protein ZWY2020_004691 [Hordeum vulgare]